MNIRQAKAKDLQVAARLANALWPEHSPKELAGELADGILRGSVCVALAEEAGQPVGFAQCGLRHDYVEGTSGSPVGYLEGIYVTPEYRRQGVARKLLALCEKWAREKGCSEFASDCELTNATSLAFHLRMGFAEANRIICFCKQL